jgi:putative peptidoglycan lipid II flippase
MVKRLFRFFNKEISGLHEAAYLLAFFAILSQLLGLVRDKWLAYAFGAGHVLDIYYAAFRVPDLIFVSIASMVSTSVLVPFFIERIEKNAVEGKKFIDHVFSAFFIAIIIVSAIVFLFVPKLVPLLLPGFANDSQLADLILMTRIILLSPIFLGLSNFLASITQMYNRFFIYALSPVFYNVGIIIGVAVFYPAMGVQGLGWGVALGAFLHFIIQVPSVVERQLFPKISLAIDWRNIGRVVKLSLPRTLTLSANQISTFFLIALASLMEKGSISVFNFSLNLQSVPLAIIGVSYSSAAFPTLTRLFTSGDTKKFLEQVVISAKHIIFWSTPLMVLFIVLRAQIVRTVLGAGQFTWSDTKLTAACLAVFMFSVIGQSLILLFVRAYYSSGNTRQPLAINLLSSTLIVVFGYVFLRMYASYPTFEYFIEALFKVENLGGSSVLMLPLAYSAGVIANTVFHWVMFHRDYADFSRPVAKTALQSFAASVIMGYVTYRSLDLFDNIFDLTTVIGVFLQGFAAGIMGIIVFIVILKLLKNKEIDDISATLHAKFWKAKVVPTEQQSL